MKTIILLLALILPFSVFSEQFFGQTTQYSGYNTGNGWKVIYANSTKANNDGQIDTFFFYVSSAANATNECKIGIYSKSRDGNLLWSATVTNSTPGTWKKVVVSPPVSYTAGDSLCPAFACNGTLGLAYGAGSDLWYETNGTTYSNQMVNPGEHGNGQNVNLSIYLHGSDVTSCTDSLKGLTVYDSTADALMLRDTVSTSGSATVIFKIATDTLSTITTASSGSKSNGDTAIHTFGPLEPSTKYFVKDSLSACQFKSNWKPHYTKDSTDSVEWFFAATPVISSAIPDSAAVGGNVTLLGTNFDKPCTIKLNGITVDTISAGVDSLRFTVPSIANGTYDLIVKTVYNKSDTLHYKVYSTIKSFLVSISHTGSGSTSPATDTTVDSGSVLTVSETPSAHNHFNGWSGDTTGAMSSFTKTIESAKTYTATFWPDSFNLTTTAYPSGSVTRSPSGSRLQYGDSVTLTDVPAANMHFVHWKHGGTNPKKIMITLDTVDTAFNGLDTFGLAYTITGGHAAVTYLGDSIAVYGESVTCTLTVSTGYTADWPGGHVGAGKHPLTVLMAKDSTLDIVTHGIPLVDSIRPGPKANRNDSCTARGVRFTNGGVVRNITAGVDAVQKSWAETQIDFYTDLTWPRGWNMLVFTNSDSLRDTAGLYITIPRKTN